MSKPRVLLIGWDAADWKLIRPLLQAGELPTLARLMADGVHGNLATVYPVLSPMVWTSIATGKRAYKHGIHGFSEPLPNGSGVRPITTLSRKSKAVWNILNQTGRHHVPASFIDSPVKLFPLHLQAQLLDTENLFPKTVLLLQLGREASCKMINLKGPDDSNLVMGMNLCGGQGVQFLKLFKKACASRCFTLPPQGFSRVRPAMER